MHTQRFRGEASEQRGKSDQALIREEDCSIVVAVQSAYLFSHAQCFFEPQTVDATKSVQLSVRSDKHEGGKDLPLEDFFVHAQVYLRPGQRTAGKP